MPEKIKFYIDRRAISAPLAVQTALAEDHPHMITLATRKNLAVNNLRAVGHRAILSELYIPVHNSLWVGALDRSGLRIDGAVYAQSHIGEIGNRLVRVWDRTTVTDVGTYDRDPHRRNGWLIRPHLQHDLPDGHSHCRACGQPREQRFPTCCMPPPTQAH